MFSPLTVHLEPSPNWPLIPDGGPQAYHYLSSRPSMAQRYMDPFCYRCRTDKTTTLLWDDILPCPILFCKRCGEKEYTGKTEGYYMFRLNVETVFYPEERMPKNGTVQQPQQPTSSSAKPTRVEPAAAADASQPPPPSSQAPHRKPA